MEKDSEYIEAVTTYRFYHDYRMKILNFTLTFNGVLLVLVAEHIQVLLAKDIVAFFAIGTTILLLGFEMRTIRFANFIWSEVERLESAHGLSTMSALKTYAEGNGIPQRYYVWLIYSLIFLVWIALIMAAHNDFL